MSSVNGATSASVNQVLAELQTRSTQATEKMGEAQNRFLTLLTTQLKNQDPMSPMENAEVTSQLAQMSTVDGIERLNTMFQQLLDSQQSAETMNAAALVGRGVLVEGGKMTLTDAGAIGGVSLDQYADAVKVSIVDASGIEVASLDLGEMEAGSQSFVWDGKALNGERAANGLYSIKVEAFADGEKVKAQTLQLGQVTGVIKGAQGADLQVGDLGIFRFEDIKQIV